MFVDLPLSELTALRPVVAEPAGFDDYWRTRIEEARQIAPTGPTLVETPSPLRSGVVHDVTFPGYGGDPIRGWLFEPADPDPDLPLVVEYVGYNGGRGDPLDWLTWVSLGVPHFVMDSRGQGGGWRTADTPDPRDSGVPSSNGFMTRGLDSPDAHYYTRLYIDAVRALDAVSSLPSAHGRPIVTTGQSQGGALSIVAAAWHPAVTATMPDVPYLANPRRAVEITDARPFDEIAQFCALYPHRIDQVFETLSYFDTVNHARRATVPALFSVALRDPIAPPSTVYAAYNWYAGSKAIEVYPFRAHEGGGVPHRYRQLAFLRGPATQAV